jgi:hypothetical protein
LLLTAPFILFFLLAVQFYKPNTHHLRVGDEIFYRSHVFVAGDKRGERTTTILAIDPSDNYPLTLDNNEQIDITTQLKITRIHQDGHLVDFHWKGFFLTLGDFILEKSILPSYERNRKSGESKRVSSLMQRLELDLQLVAQEHSMPTDFITVGIHKKADVINTKQRNIEVQEDNGKKGIDVTQFMYYRFLPKTREGFMFLLQPLAVPVYGYTMCFLGYTNHEDGSIPECQKKKKFKNEGDIFVSFDDVDMKGKPPSEIFSFLCFLKKNRKKRNLKVKLIDIVALNAAT